MIGNALALLSGDVEGESSIGEVSERLGHWPPSEPIACSVRF